MHNDLTQDLSKGVPASTGDSRECGACTACCTVMAVHELQKENYRTCCHAADGCTIYATRPDSCREWSCLWLQGGMEREVHSRPDRLGLVFSVEARGQFPLLTAYEVWPDAAQQPRAKYVLDELGKLCSIVLVDPQNQFVVSSPNASFEAAFTVRSEKARCLAGSSALPPDRLYQLSAVADE